MPSPMTAIRISAHLTAEGLSRGVDMLGHLVKLLRGQGLGAVGEGVLGIVVNLDDQAVGSGGHGGQGQRLYQPADAEAWLGSTMTGRWDSFFRIGTAEMSRVFRV